LNGHKTLSTNSGHTHSYVVSTLAADPEAPANMFSCVVVEAGAEGIRLGPEFDGLGMRGNSSRDLIFENVVLPPHSLLGEEGDQIWYIFHIVAPYFLVAMAGTYLGIAGRAVQIAREHLAGRVYTHSGRSLGQEPVLQHRLGCLWAEVERVRHFTYWAAEEAERGGPQALPALCSAKAEVGDCAVRVTNEALTLCGGREYRNGGMLSRLMRDARAAHVMAPTTDILRTWTGKALLDLPLLVDG
jgi:alkylation response protein AidB-like acyl-CoA dehydrogenase